MSTQHTPGPWSVQLLEQGRDGYEGWNSYCVRDEKTNVHIASVGHVDRYFEQHNEANARLIAAAPDMLAALNEFEALDDENNGLDDLLDDLYAAIETARAAIAKATGAQS